jgi:hypothetical protein
MAQRGRPRKVADVQDVDFEDSIVDKEIMGEEAEPTPPPKPTSDSDIVGEGTFNDYNPFNESVVERDYATPKPASGLIDELEEPSFVPPSYEDIIQERQEQEATGINDTFDNPFDNPNPAMNDLDSKDKKIACESLVDTVLDAYEQAHRYAQYVVKVDEETLMQKQAEGKIDLSMQIPVSETGDTMSVAEFVAQYNEQGANAIKYDKEFGIKVRPAMIRVFMKRGWGMTDEQFLLYMFGKDIAIKVGIMFQLKKTINGTLETIEKMHRRNGGGGGAQGGYEQTRQGTIIEEEEDDSYEVEDYGYEQEQEQQPQGDNFTSSMNINMPQNPVDPNKGHPKEVQNILRNERKNK